jgi:hypothetical protein
MDFVAATTLSVSDTPDKFENLPGTRTDVHFAPFDRARNSEVDVR